MNNLKKHSLFSGFLSLPEESQEALLNICGVTACGVSIALQLKYQPIQSNSFLNKLEKKLDAYKIVRSAFRDFKKISEYRICKFITFVVIDLDDMLDGNKKGQYQIYLKQAESKLDELLEKEKVDDEQKGYILKLFNLTVKDIEVDSGLNNCDQSQQESLDILRENGYPSTLVGIAICLGLMSDEGNYKYDGNTEFKALIDNITYMARICDDVVSDVDARNLVWDKKVGEFKEVVSLDILSKKIIVLKNKIENSISQLDFNEDQKQFVGSVAFYYLEYLKKWLSRQDADLLIQLNDLI
jgi:hypothetical protein